MSERKLILSVTKKDFDISFFSGSGAGGQHRNRHMNSVRIKHRDSGAMATGQDQRSLKDNLRNAFLRCIEQPKYKTWERLEVAKRLRDNSALEETVNRQMHESNLKVEIKDEKGRWKEISEQEWKVLEEMEKELDV
jgi:protein subunit release factor B